MPSSVLRFKSLRLCNYKIFRGVHEFSLDRPRTVIVGGNGSGKTTLAQALVHLGPAPEVTTNVQPGTADMSVEVATTGNRGLIEMHRDLLLLSGEDMENPGYPRIPNISDPNILLHIHEDAKSIFTSLLSLKPWKQEAHRDLKPENMAMGERICLGYAFFFAARRVLGLDIPLVFDSPFGKLDAGLRQGLAAFLKTQSCQQILLGTAQEFREEDSPHYVLSPSGHEDIDRNE
jgi:ABC-type glutathione transport system ATPase component